MNTIFTFNYASPLGSLIIGDFNNQLCMLDWEYRAKRKQIDERVKTFLNAQYVAQKTPLHEATIFQLESYFSKERKHFDLPLCLAGSSFQQSVWQALLKLPFGKTESYLSLSQKLGNEKAIRAVAAANGANAISIIIPCHRVIGAKGELTGYAGGLKAKQSLLNLEGISHQTELF